MPERDPAAAARANLATLIALFGLLVASAGILGLIALVLGPMFVGFIIGGCLVFIGPVAFHYLVWGRWLSKMKEESPDDDSATPRD